MRDKGSAKQKSVTCLLFFSSKIKLTLIRQIKIKLQIKSWVPLR